MGTETRLTSFHTYQPAAPTSATTLATAGTIHLRLPTSSPTWAPDCFAAKTLRATSRWVVSLGTIAAMVLRVLAVSGSGAGAESGSTIGTGISSRARLLRTVLAGTNLFVSIAGDPSGAISGVAGTGSSTASMRECGAVAGWIRAILSAVAALDACSALLSVSLARLASSARRSASRSRLMGPSLARFLERPRCAEVKPQDSTGRVRGWHL